MLEILDNVVDIPKQRGIVQRERTPIELVVLNSCSDIISSCDTDSQTPEIIKTKKTGYRRRTRKRIQLFIE